jgi:hypothetical protein
MRVSLQLGSWLVRLGAWLLSPGFTNRLIAAAVLVPCATLLLVAARLEPDPAGLGTHTQLRLPPCGFDAATGLPCMSCGMTTSFAHAANGDLISAFLVQPMGTLLAVITTLLVWISGYAMIFGLSLAPVGRWLSQTRVVVALMIFAVLAWGWTLSSAVLGVS